MSFLHDLALAHQTHEGWFPGSMSYRNNNPGNLRGKDGAFQIFPSYQAGFTALQNDLQAKIEGRAPSVLTTTGVVALGKDMTQSSQPVVQSDRRVKPALIVWSFGPPP